MGELGLDGLCAPGERVLHRPLWIHLFPVAYDIQSRSLDFKLTFPTPQRDGVLVAPRVIS